MAVPEDIIMEEILPRLPMKSLIRFRCVCKSWNSLLYNPEYLSQYLNRGIPQTPKRDTDCLIFMNKYNDRKYNHCDLSILSGDSKKLSETRINNALYPLSLSEDEIHLVGSVNGLVCMAFHDFEGNYKFILWNPTIRFSKTILVPKHLGFEVCPPFLYGFGWDSVTNDYKLLVKPLNRLSPAGVYSCQKDCRSNSINSLSIVDSASIYEYKPPCVIVNGCPYWSNWKKSNIILKFDITSNTFISFSVGRFYYSLINLNDCLGLINYGSWYAAEVVYRVDEERHRMTKMYTIDKCVNNLSMRLYCFNYGGEIVFHGEKKHLYLYDPKSKETKCCHPYPHCGGCLVESCKRKRKHGGSHECGGCLVNGFSYTPSLVAVPGMKALHL